MFFKDGFNKNGVLESVSSKYIAKNIVYKKMVESTNDLAKENKAMSEGTLFVADRQSKGRGRNSRKWVSDSKDGLWFSLLLKPGVRICDISNITLIAGLCVKKVLDKLCDVEFLIKWPNDIVCDGKKLCGILCESTKDNDENVIILGIGINLNQKKFKKEISDIATSVRVKTGKNLKREDFLICFSQMLEEMYENTLKYGFSYYKEEYKESSATLGKEIYIISSDKKERAIALDIADNGDLIADVDGKIKNIFFGEVSVRGIY